MLLNWALTLKSDAKQIPKVNDIQTTIDHNDNVNVQVIVYII